MPDQPTRQAIATLADLGVTPHCGPTWAAADIADALTGVGPADTGMLAVHPAVRAAAHRLADRIAAVLPAGLDLVGDVVVGPAGTDLTTLAHHAVRWKERAAFAEIVAATGLWQPPGTDEAPQVRIEGRADRISPAGHHISHLAPQPTSSTGPSTPSAPTGSPTGSPTSPTSTTRAATPTAGTGPQPSSAPTTSRRSRTPRAPSQEQPAIHCPRRPHH